MSIFEIISHRRSVYPEQFMDKPVSKEDITKMLEAANWAPTHKKTEPWRFKVIQGEESQAKLGDFMALQYKKGTPEDKFSAFKHKNVGQKARLSGAVIAICMQRDPKESLPEWEELAATAMAVQNMWLMATALGLGGYWGSPGFISKMGEFFDLADGEKCLGFFFVGHYETESPEGVRKPIGDKVVWM